jgi:DNA-binding NarL/FixJ family response regulator
MEASKTVNITIVAGNPLFSEMLKKSMETMVQDQVSIHSIENSDDFFKELENLKIKPDIVVLDYSLNKACKDVDVCSNTLERLKELNPDTSVIIMANEADMDQGAKMLSYGANEFVIKDKFVFSHISNAVKSLLNPSKL